MDEKKLFDALDKFPETIKKVDELADAVEKNNKTTTDNVAAISRAVSGQNDKLTKVETQLTALSNSITAAKNQMQKEVTVQVRPADVHITKDDIRITQQTPIWLQEQAKEYAELKKKEKQPIIIQGKWFLVLSIIILIGFIVLCAVHYVGSKNKKEFWADRDYKAAVELKFENPGSYYHSIIEKFEAGYVEEAKNIVLNHEAEAKDHGKTTKKYEKQLTEYLVNVSQFKDGIKVISWETKTVKGKTVTFVRFFNVRNQEEWKVIIESDSHAAFTVDEKINTLKDATRNANQKRKIWQYQGDFTKPYVEPVI